MRIFAALILALAASSVLAGETTFAWAFDPVDCGGNPVDPSEYTALEIYVDTVPIPAADSGCVVDGAMLDVPPNATPIVGIPQDNSVTTNLPGGHYFVRARVRLDGAWSQLSPQIERDVGREAMVIQLAL